MSATVSGLYGAANVWCPTFWGMNIPNPYANSEREFKQASDSGWAWMTQIVLTIALFAIKNPILTLQAFALWEAAHYFATGIAGGFISEILNLVSFTPGFSLNYPYAILAVFVIGAFLKHKTAFTKPVYLSLAILAYGMAHIDALAGAKLFSYWILIPAVIVNAILGSFFLSMKGGMNDDGDFQPNPLASGIAYIVFPLLSGLALLVLHFLPTPELANARKNHEILKAAAERQSLEPQYLEENGKLVYENGSKETPATLTCDLRDIEAYGSIKNGIVLSLHSQTVVVVIRPSDTPSPYAFLSKVLEEIGTPDVYKGLDFRAYVVGLRGHGDRFYTMNQDRYAPASYGIWVTPSGKDGTEIRVGVMTFGYSPTFRRLAGVLILSIPHVSTDSTALVALRNGETSNPEFDALVDKINISSIEKFITPMLEMNKH